MWGADTIAYRELLIRIVMATKGRYTEDYLLSLAPFEVFMIEKLVAKIIKEDSPNNYEDYQNQFQQQ